MSEMQRYNPENESWVEKNKPKKAEFFDIRLAEGLVVGNIYELPYLEQKLGISAEEGLFDVTKDKIVFEDLGKGLRFQYKGKIGDVDKEIREKSRMEASRTKLRRLKENLKRLTINQTYSEKDLVEIFDIRMNEGLIRHLSPYTKFEKLENRNYKLHDLITGEAEEGGAEQGYNYLVNEVFKVLKNKYGSKNFSFLLTDVPGPLRRKMPAGLLPRIYRYLIDSEMIEEIEGKQGKYRIIERE